jgi:hypothetical protein
VTASQPRSLPLRVAIAAGEALDAWLLRLARRNEVPAQWLLSDLGLDELVRIKSSRILVAGLSAEQLRRIEQQAGLATGALDTAVLQHCTPAGWRALPGSRFCPQCLREPDAHWLIRWRLPYTFACLRHHCLLAGYCPACQQVPHSRWSPVTGQVDAHWCTLRPLTGELCGADLREHPLHRLDPDDPRLDAQRWIHARLDTVTDPDAAGQLQDLHLLAQRFRRRLRPADLEHLGEATVAAATEYRRIRSRNTNYIKRVFETDVTAAVATQAVQLLSASTPASLFARFRPLIREAAPNDRPRTLSRNSLAAFTAALQVRLLAACDPHLTSGDRLRYRSTTPTPRLPDPTSATAAADRARHLPEYLWREWIIRFSPGAGLSSDSIATDIPAALLLPGNPTSNRAASTELTAWRANTGPTLSLLAEQYPDTLTALCALADYLDVHGSPIDYRRRRALFTDIAMNWQQWEDLCDRADIHPGQQTRHLNGCRHVFAQLTGANLANTRHRLAFHTADDRNEYVTGFQRELSLALRDALHGYGLDILRTAGIDEPLTWSPPSDCIYGLRLPGREPDDIDLDAVGDLVDRQGLSITAAADELRVTTTHIRYALSLRERLGASRKRRRAARTSATLPSNKRIYVDPDYLRDQTEIHQRSSTEIARDLGLSAGTVIRNLVEYGIARRPQGSAGNPAHSRTYPDLPTDVRLAVEGQQYGWLRLRRFQQLVAYPTLDIARQALGTHVGTLSSQIARLEADIGKPILKRGHVGRPMTPTEHGQALLALLEQPRVAQLLDQYAKPIRGWRADDPRRLQPDRYALRRRNEVRNAGTT